jgi:aldehyde dehydrogenase (NAD+)
VFEEAAMPLPGSGTVSALDTGGIDTGGIAHPERIAALERVRELLVSDRDRVLRLLTEGCTYRAAEYELDGAVATLAGAVAEVGTHRPGPVSRVAVFMPSNVLLYSYVLYLLVPTLFAEQVRFRPASLVARQLLSLHEALAPAHRLPIEPMAVSQRAFVRDGVGPADVVVFTGAYQNAEELRQQLGHGQLFLYLGSGINPFIVAPGADLDLAVRDAVAIRLLNSGQDCLAPDLFCVNRADLESFVDLLVRQLVSTRYGDYSDPGADFGPILYDDALEHAGQYLLRHQRHLVHGGRIDFRTRRVDPAVVVRPWGGKVPEVFAPIFTVVGYEDEARLADTLAGGVFAERAMGASVYGRSPRLVEALRERHMVTVDATLLSIDNGNEPFGGRGPMANYVTCDGRLHPEPILVSKAVADHLAPGRDRSVRAQPERRDRGPRAVRLAS